LPRLERRRDRADDDRFFGKGLAGRFERIRITPAA
jgi:hypothetical protein